jgi:uncharacterized protein YcfJ
MTKTRILLLATAVLSLSGSASAQLFRPETVTGAVWGGLAGAVIGHNSGDLGNDAWRGAALGAVAGGVVGEAVASSRDPAVPRPSRVGGPMRSPRVAYADVGWSSRPRGSFYHHRTYRGYPVGDPWAWHRPGRVWAPGHAVRVVMPVDTRPADPRVTGAILGGAAGAVIGHNRGRQTWEGAAIGSLAGWILGGHAQARGVDPVAVVPAAAPASPESPAPAGLTVINHYHGPVTITGAGANALFGR